MNNIDTAEKEIAAAAGGVDIAGEEVYDDRSYNQLWSSCSPLSPLNEEVLNQLRNNDPNITSLRVQTNIDWIWEQNARCIAENTHIKTLVVNRGQQSTDFPKSFYNAVGCNNSIRHLFLRLNYCPFDMGEMLRTLMPFFDRNGSKLLSLELHNFEHTPGGYKRVDLLIEALSKCTSLQRFGIESDRFDDQCQFYDDESALELLTELVKHPTLRRLGIVLNNRVKRVNLQDVLPKITMLKNFRLYSGIDDVEAKWLSLALKGSKGIKKLLLEGNSNISSVGWGAIFQYIGSSLLEELTLNKNFIDDESLFILAKGLVTNDSLKNLNISYIESATSFGWQVMFDRLCGSNLALVKLKFSYINSIDDNAIASMLSWLLTMPSLKRLNINDMTYDEDIISITSIGWLRFSSLISNSSLTHLNLYFNSNIDDEVMISYASALSNNNTLESLRVDGTAITTKARTALTNALCDKSSFESITASNHTLKDIGRTYENGRVRRYPDLDSLLQLNQNDNKAEVVRQKIIQYHFCHGSSNMKKLVSMDREILPQAISWIGRNEAGLSLFFRLCQSIPSLFDSESKAKANRAKRKRL